MTALILGIFAILANLILGIFGIALCVLFIAAFVACLPFILVGGLVVLILDAL